MAEPNFKERSSVLCLYFFDRILGYYFVDIRDANDFRSRVRTINDVRASDKYLSRDQWPIESVLLYTDEDIDLAKYVRQNFSALDGMTGDNLNIYTIEKPIRLTSISARKYWKAVLDQSTYSFLHQLGLTRYKPYDKAHVYEIANMLGVYPDALPCVVIFGDIKSDEKIVVTISGDYKTFFRGLATVALRAREKLAETQFNMVDDFGEFKKILIANWNIWEEKAEKGEARTTSFVFNGQTVFINKPSGQYEIKDFQNG
jgi:hypothetical protein